MSAFVGFLLLMLVPVNVFADVFQPARPADTRLRQALAEDRAAFYEKTPGFDRAAASESISDIKSLGVDSLARPQGLRDMDKAFDVFLLEELSKDREYKGLVAPGHPLLLLEYASPVLADVVKHYRVSAYERLAIEQARLSEIERATESARDRLSRQSERACLERNESRGLVAAMRLCQKASKSFDALVSVDGQDTLADGRRRIHVLAQALARLGLDKAHIDNLVDIAGDQVFSDDGQEEQLPAFTFEEKIDGAREKLAGAWRAALDKFHAMGNVTAVKLEELSLPGVPVTQRTLAELDLMDPAESGSALLKLASALAFVNVRQQYRDAAGYIDLCARDPVLPEEFRRILLIKGEYLSRVARDAGENDGGLAGYKTLLASLADAADVARQRLSRSREPVPASDIRELMLNF